MLLFTDYPSDNLIDAIAEALTVSPHVEELVLRGQVSGDAVARNCATSTCNAPHLCMLLHHGPSHPHALLYNVSSVTRMSKLATALKECTQLKRLWLTGARAGSAWHCVRVLVV